MIRIDDDYYIDVEGRNYIICKDYHRTEVRKMPDGREAKFKAFEAIAYIKGGQAERAKARSKTFHGIAKAMAEQWG